MNEREFERREKARLDEMWDANINNEDCEVDQQFDDWWEHEENMTSHNPYTKGGVLFWSWEGWVAGRKAERNTCLEILKNIWQQEGDKNNIQFNVLKCIQLIEARGKND